MRIQRLLLALPVCLLPACSQGAEPVLGSGLASSAVASMAADAGAQSAPAAAQDASGEASQDKKPDQPKAKPKKGFTPPPAKKVPGTGKPAPAPAKGAGEKGADVTPEQAKKRAEAAAKLEEQLQKAGASDEEIRKKLDALTGAAGKRPGVATQVDPNAKLVVEFGKEKHDFGRARQGDILEHTFEMQAGGTSPLVIRQASPTCGCTVGEVKVEGEGGEMEVYAMGDPIQPGKRVTINAKLNSASKRNRTQVKINVYHNDPAGLTMLGLTADIEPFITATPQFLNFGDVKMGETRTQTVDIRTSRGEPVMLTPDTTRPIPTPDGLQIELVPVNPGDDGKASHWQAKVSVGEGAKEGSLGYQLALVSDVEMAEDHSKHNHAEGEHVDPPGVKAVPQFHRVNASVSARILGALSHQPQFVSLGLVRPGQVVPRLVKVMAHDSSVDLTKVTAKLRGDKGGELRFAEHLSTSVKPSANGQGVDVELRLNGLPEGSDGSFRGELVIETGHASKPEIIVHFSGVCRAGVR